jgi:lysozyme
MQQKSRNKVAAMALSAVALVGLVSHEGYRQVTYIPVEGDVPTLGFGTTTGVKPGDTTDPVSALQRVMVDVQKFEGAIKSCVTVPLAQNEYDAYVSLIYNIGPGKEGVSDGFCWLRKGGPSTLVRRLNSGDYAGACEAILMWNKFKGRELRGLTNRRQAEYQLCIG